MYKTNNSNMMELQGWLTISSGRWQHRYSDYKDEFAINGKRFCKPIVSTSANMSKSFSKFLFDK
jgi:hypothetical protein